MRLYLVVFGEGRCFTERYKTLAEAEERLYEIGEGHIEYLCPECEGAMGFGGPPVCTC
jgi:hypothetical protein